MPVNRSEARLFEFVQRTFLKLWSYANPYRAPGKEIADVIVVFGNDLVVFSDKASTYRDGASAEAWKRWYRRTISESVKQLLGAARVLCESDSPIFVDDRASKAFPFSLPPADKRRVHLVAVARSAKELADSDRPDLYFDSRVIDGEKPFHVGRLGTKDHVVHVFEATTLETLLTELDTTSDFVSYLSERETLITENTSLYFYELDLLMLVLIERSAGGWGLVLDTNKLIPEGTNVPSGLWTDAYARERRDSSRSANRITYNIDKFIDHFHEEYLEGRLYMQVNRNFESHEQALRLMARENRFGRRIIAAALTTILEEKDYGRFWASTVESQNTKRIRYIWLTYPEPSDKLSIDRTEEIILQHLKEHIFVARSIFVADLIIGIALPNLGVTEIKSYFLVVFDGTRWNEEAQRGAEALRKEKGIFRELEAFTSQHVV